MNNGNFTGKAKNVLTSAMSTARTLGHTYVGSEHLLLALALENECVASRMLKSRGALADRIRSAIISASGRGEVTDLGVSDLTPALKRIIEESGVLSRQYGQGYVGTEHILLSLLGESECMACRILQAIEVSIPELRGDLALFLGGEKTKAKPQRSETKAASVLSGYGRDLTALARQGRLDPIIGREEETARVVRILSRRVKNNPCLIGEPGVGKTAVVEGLAQLIVQRRVPPSLADKSIVALDLTSMIAGAKYRGEFEERMKNVMKEVEGRPDILLFVDELHTIVGAGAAEGAVDAANIIKPALARGELRMIGATTLDEYRRHIEKDSALERRFQPIIVGEPSDEETLAILLGLRDRYEAHHGLRITDAALRAAVELSSRYIGDRFLPDKAIDLLDETAARIRVSGSEVVSERRKIEEEILRLRREKEEAISAQSFELAAKLRDRERKLRQESLGKEELSELPERRVDAADIAETVQAQTGIPIGELRGEDSERLSCLEERLSARVIGQASAVATVARAVCRGRMGFADPARPVGSFLFVGPSGVGKTELAKALAETVFGNASALVRLDMSEFSEKHSVSRLIGSPPGYVGYDDGGLLTDRVRRAPHSLVLFDEIEKAHPDIYDLLLQILDDGRLTDSHGRTCNFKSCIVILTSNLGNDDGVRRLGFGETGETAKHDRIMTELKKCFRPELLDRIDEVVLFSPLGKDELMRIADSALAELAERAEAMGIKVEFDCSVTEYLAEGVISSRQGARPIRGRVTRSVGDLLSRALLDGTVKAGQRVKLSAEDGELRVKST